MGSVSKIQPGEHDEEKGHLKGSHSGKMSFAIL